MAFGFDRTVEAATAANLIPISASGTQVLVTIFDASTQKAALEIASKLRSAQIRTEVYPSLDKLDKQFKLANQKDIPLVIVIGPQEKTDQTVVVKDMRTGKQESVPQNNILSTITELFKGK
jgi:histidyl-tRNA synthetase